MMHRATEAIEPPNHKRVALLQPIKASIQLRAIRFCSRDLLGEDVVYLDAKDGKRINLK